MHNRDPIFGVDFGGTLKVRVVERTFFEEQWNITRGGDHGVVGLLGVVAIQPEDPESPPVSVLALTHPTSCEPLMQELQDPLFLGICAGGGIMFREGHVEDGRTWAAYPIEASGLIVE